MSTPPYAIVIGVGGMGSAAVYHLAKSGARVLGLERFEVPHAFGSSHGLTRIIRLAYSEGSHYVPLLRDAYRYWREIEEVSGESILQVTGGLDIGPEGGGIVQGSRKSCVEHGLPFEELDSVEVNRRFPGYRLPRTMRAIHQPTPDTFAAKRRSLSMPPRRAPSAPRPLAPVVCWPREHPNPEDAQLGEGGVPVGCFLVGLAVPAGGRSASGGTT